MQDVEKFVSNRAREMRSFDTRERTGRRMGFAPKYDHLAPEIAKLRAKGYGVNRIAKELGIGNGTVQDLEKRHLIGR